MKRAVIGILAHVDAGKTTFAEALLYHTGTIRKAGRVDDKNTLLDSHILEKERVRKTSRRAKFAQTTLKKPKHKTDLKFRRFSPTANMSTGIDDDFMTSVRPELLKETFRDRENARTKPAMPPQVMTMMERRTA